MTDSELPKNTALEGVAPDSDGGSGVVSDTRSAGYSDQPGRSPLEHLSHLSSLTLGESAIEAPVETARSWRGFAFKSGGLNLVFPFMGGFEILAERDIQPIPWAVDWVRGITNVRGEIYSVVDFAAYLGIGSVHSLRNATVFLLPDVTVRTALLISERVVLKTFSEFLPQRDAPDAPQRLQEIVDTVLVDAGQQWYVLDVTKLTSSQTFLDIAA